MTPPSETKSIEATIPQNELFASGSFWLGCNYWASHAGAFMWRDWQPDVVDADLQKLAAAGLQWLRVFPLWPDFQPIQQLRGQNGAPVEIRLGEEPLPDDEIGQAGLSAIMISRFAEFAEMAEKHGLKLVVGLITGWMSGRLFVPPALEGLNPITDPTSIAWQIKFVRGFVSALNKSPAIAAWDLGNECNCMGIAPTPDAAYLWTAAIANAIRSADATRPIVSGMHSLSVAGNSIGNSWLISDQAALTDVLTTHPYPYWVRHTNIDAVDSLRVTLHATAESRFYADIGGKPCIAEEIGTMGPMVAGDATSADFARVNMFSLWANDCRAMAWWCAHDQTELADAPYDWNGVELELGLLRTDGSPKPVLQEMSAFRAFLDTLPFKTLAKPEPQAICLLSHNQDDWATAYGSYVLAKQAKLEIAFRHIQQPIPNAPIYLLPSLKGANAVPRRKWLELLDRVKAGATLYMSLGDGIVPGFNEATGATLHTRAKAAKPMAMSLADGTEIELLGGDDLVLTASTAQVLGRRTDTGSPAFWKNGYGAGTIYVLAAPIESELSTRPRAFGSDASPYWKIYRELAAAQPQPLTIDDPDLALTLHHQPDGKVIACLINHTGQPKVVPLLPASGLAIANCWRGETTQALGRMVLNLKSFDAAIIELVAT